MTYALLGGLIVSRFGLWTVDLAVSQLLQEWVADDELGALLTPPIPFLFSLLSAAARRGVPVLRPRAHRRNLLTQCVQVSLKDTHPLDRRYISDFQKDVIKSLKNGL